ncbi:GNAT family N-acetyltransferase [Nocardia crassostreae]|uniref:GNAT family N-acetyltransferase n=1 Tax=Nocardia crassostreae TaxID=53428 RepID=UPI000A06EAA9|nr:GNAT family N-acetyltransferase [Nocardia crassostreae]
MLAFEQPQAPSLRVARRADLAAIHSIETKELERLAYPYFVLRQLFELHGTEWIVAEDKGRVCGYVLTAITTHDTAWFVGFAVARSCTGRGYGRALLETSLAICHDAHVDQVFVTAYPGNRIAYHLYKEVGFVWADHEIDYFGPDEPRDILVHRLYH